VKGVRIRMCTVLVYQYVYSTGVSVCVQYCCISMCTVLVYLYVYSTAVSVCVQYRCRELYSLALYPFAPWLPVLLWLSVNSSFPMQYRYIARQFNWQKNWWIKNCGRGDWNLSLNLTIFFRPSVVLDITHCPECIFVSWIVIAGTQWILWWGEQKQSPEFDAQKIDCSQQIQTAGL
jgi:hypothetical protein